VADLKNVDSKTVLSFGDEWSRYDQSTLDVCEREEIFAEYFSIFPWDELPPAAVGIDAGCGSGRWALSVAERVGKLHCTDASERAIDVARKNLDNCENVSFHVCDIGELPVEDASMDFCYSLGVLHHIPEPLEAMCCCVDKLKPGAPFLVYLYYRFDNKPSWYALIWRFSDSIRRVVSRQSPQRKALVSKLVAYTIYWPLSRLARIVEKVGFDPDLVPLSYYRGHSMLTMHTDARDRLGTPLEHRFTRNEILAMMDTAGLENIEFSDARPYWCAVGRRKFD